MLNSVESERSNFRLAIKIHSERMVFCRETLETIFPKIIYTKAFHHFSSLVQNRLVEILLVHIYRSILVEKLDLH